MKILITGAKGFIGKNLIETLRAQGKHILYEFDMDSDLLMLQEYTKDCEFVFHLAGVNRPENPEDFMKNNFGFTGILLDLLKASGNQAPVLITSSTQAALDNPYGKSKRAGEELIAEYGLENGVPTFVYRLPNVFGKWSRPNYNSAAATFCHNIAHSLPIQVNNRDTLMNLVYIDDVVEEFIGILNADASKNSLSKDQGSRQEDGFLSVEPVYSVTLGYIVELLYSFYGSRNNLSIPDMADGFTRDLYATYLSFLPEDQFSYTLKMNTDARGSFTEFIKTPDRGQVSVNISRPGIIKGNHWHHTKNEKFLVVSGSGVIRFRKTGSDRVIEYFVSSSHLEVVDIPTGYTHNIENLGDTDMVTLMWASEAFDKDRPDSYYLDV